MQLPQDQDLDGDLLWHPAQAEKSWQSKGKTYRKRRLSPLTNEPIFILYKVVSRSA